MPSGQNWLGGVGNFQDQAFSAIAPGQGPPSPNRELVNGDDDNPSGFPEILFNQLFSSRLREFKESNSSACRLIE